jgi:tetratricopeptide (TPR) repeat protein
MKAKLCVILLACITLVPPSQCSEAQPGGLTPAMQQAVEYTELGDLSFNQGLYDKALEEYAMAIELDPGLAAAYWGRGRVYHFDQGLYSKAAGEYSEAISLNPDYIEAYYYRGLAYTANGVYERAIADFSTVIELDPGMAMAYNLRAWCYVHEAQWEQVSQYNLYHSFKLDSIMAEAYVGQGWSYVKQMQWELFTVPYLVRDADSVTIEGKQYDSALSSIPEKPEPDGGKFPDVPYVKVTPVSGPVGTQLFIYGWGFRSGEDGITVTWDGDIIICNISAETDGSIQIDGSEQPDGTPRARIYVPESIQGDHIVSVYGSSFTPRGIVNDTIFKVAPKLKLSHEPHAEGTQITVTGTGFADEKDISIRLDETATDASAATDSNGSFTVRLTTAAVKGKEYMVTATDSKENSAQASFTLTLARPLPNGQKPDIVEVYANRGFAHFKKAQWALAIADLENAYAENPSLNRGQWNMDWALHKQEQWDMVISDYDKVIALNTGSPVPTDTSNPVVLQEELSLALADYHKAASISNDPSFAEKIEYAIQFIEQWGDSID